MHHFLSDYPCSGHSFLLANMNNKRDKQIRFHVCQKCNQIVENIYQKGYCKNCLMIFFQPLKKVIDNAHASREKELG